MEPISQTQQVKMEGVEVKAPPSTDIFVSHAGDAGEWAQKLVSMLQLSGSYVGRQELGGGGEGKLSRKYDAFVAVITPEYVAANEAGIDTSAFIGPGGGGARRFAVYLQRAPWQELPWMARFTVLPDGEHAVLDAKDPDRLLAEIAQTIRERVSAAVQAETPAPAPGIAGDAPAAVDYFAQRYQLSDSVAAILESAAESIRGLQGRPWLDTRRVFRALADHGRTEGPPQWSADWLRLRVGEKLEALSKPRRAGTGIEFSPRLKPPVSSGVAAVLESAAAIAQRTHRKPEIRPRHLLAALLTDARGDGSLVLQLLSGEGVDVHALREEFYDFVRDDGEDDAEWARILLGETADTRLLAHFDADDSRSDDYLDVRPDVLAFAGLVAARTLTPPLSIGLFGEWGSGKTFFMRMLRREVDRLAQQADAADEMQCRLPFWKRIIQIEFNAWHYVEGNLWASLVQHIFDNLRFADEPRPSASQELQKHLLDQIGHEKQAEAQARREKDAAERQVTEAQREVTRAREAYVSTARDLAAMSRRNVLADVPVPVIREEVDGALKALGLDRVGASALELRTALGQARTLLGRGRAVAAPLLYGEPEMRRRRWQHLLLALFAGPAAAFAVGGVLEWIGPEGLEAIGAWSAGAAGLLSAVAAWIRSQLTRADEWIQQVEDAQRRLDDTVARAQAQNVQQMREAEERLRLREADYQAAHRRQEEAQRRAADAQQRLAEASLAGVLSTFIEDRANSTDYRKQLGTLALVRNDFERLSALIEEENWRLSPPVPGENTTRRGLERFATLKQERIDRARRINRIVLYIDDLDRCPPAKVVEVLQAVHLLLAFPLFVVVVGVDARWITRSLEARYRELLAVDGRGERGERREVDDFQELFGSATAHDYLEKIFQVPFWLRPMGDGGAQAMVQGLLAPSLVSRKKAADTPSPGASTATPDASDTPRPDATHPAPSAEAANAAVAEPRAAEGAATPGPGEAEQKVEAPAKREEPDLTAESLEITDAELQFMHELAPLLGRSPRALKRFVNVYRLIKASLAPHELRAFVPASGRGGDYQYVLFLLAVDTGTPLAAPPLFGAIIAAAAEEAAGERGTSVLARVVERLDGEPEDVPGWARIREWLLSGNREIRLAGADARRLSTWVSRISRFSFHTGRIPVPPAAPERAEPPEAPELEASMARASA